MTNYQTAVKATYFSIISNTALALIKGVAGIFGNSYALIADAIESTADIFSSLLVLFGLNMPVGLQMKIIPMGMAVLSH